MARSCSNLYNKGQLAQMCRKNHAQSVLSGVGSGTCADDRTCLTASAQYGLTYLPCISARACSAHTALPCSCRFCLSGRTNKKANPSVRIFIGFVVRNSYTAILFLQSSIRTVTRLPYYCFSLNKSR